MENGDNSKLFNFLLKATTIKAVKDFIFNCLLIFFMGAPFGGGGALPVG
jgi:hypothetical protein